MSNDTKSGIIYRDTNVHNIYVRHRSHKRRGLIYVSEYVLCILYTWVLNNIIIMKAITIFESNNSWRNVQYKYNISDMVVYLVRTCVDAVIWPVVYCTTYIGVQK